MTVKERQAVAAITLKARTGRHSYFLAFFIFLLSPIYLEKLPKWQIGVYSPKDLLNSNLLSRIDIWSKSYGSEVGHIFSEHTGPMLCMARSAVPPLIIFYS